MRTSTQVMGAKGEDLAAEWYLDHGFTVVERNWRTNAGEIDLIASDGDTVVFSEVKTRASLRYGHPAEAVGWAKQRRIRGLAVEWMRSARHRGPIRFDVVAIVSGHVTVIEGAF